MIKSKMVHWHVDSAGKTNVDQFESGIPLDMEGEVPDETHIVLNTPANARLFGEIYEECVNQDGIKVMFTGCPAVGLEGVDTFEKAKLCVRQLCFENEHPMKGGLRPVTRRDRSINRLTAMYHELQSSLHARFSDVSEINPESLSASFKEYQDQVGGDKMIMTVSGHPVWRRLSWIYGMNPGIAFALLGSIVDPTWYIDQANPLSSVRFKQRFGLYDWDDSLVGEGCGKDVAPTLLMAMNEYATAEKRPDINEPSLYFHRYAMRCALAEEASRGEMMLSELGWRFTERLCNFIWLSWLEAIHDFSPRYLDEERFFGDRVVARVAFVSACT